MATVALEAILKPIEDASAPVAIGVVPVMGAVVVGAGAVVLGVGAVVVCASAAPASEHSIVAPRISFCISYLPVSMVRRTAAITVQ